jgi:hypothetical protein
MLSGSAFRTVAFTRENTFALRSGELKIYIKTGDSGTKRLQAFCPECGTPIYSTSTGEGPKVHSIRVGTIRQRRRPGPENAVVGPLGATLDRRGRFTPSSRNSTRFRPGRGTHEDR